MLGVARRVAINELTEFDRASLVVRVPVPVGDESVTVRAVGDYALLHDDGLVRWPALPAPGPPQPDVIPKAHRIGAWSTMWP